MKAEGQGATGGKNPGGMRSGATVIGLRIGAAGLAYMLVVILARWLSPQDFGRYSLIISVITLAAIVARLGADVAVVRFLGVYHATKATDLAEGLVRTSTRWVLALAGAIGLAAAALIWLWLGPTGAATPYIVAALLVFPAFALTDVMSAILRSYGENVSALAPKDIVWRIATIAVAGAVVGLALPEGVALSVLMAGSGLVLIGLTLWQYLRQEALRLRKDGPVAQPRTDIAAWRRSAVYVMVGLVARNAARNLDVVLVGALLSVPLAGAYFAASRTAELLGFMLSALNMLVGPAVARGTAEGKIADTQHKLSLMALFLAGSTGLLLAIIVLFGNTILGLMNPEFVAAYPVLLVLLLGQLVNVCAGSAGVVLNMTGHDRTTARIQLMVAPVSLALLSVLTPVFGVMGTAWASTIGLAAWNIWLWIEVRRKTPYDPSVWGILRLRPSPRGRP